jgi:hypothetical protein
MVMRLLQDGMYSMHRFLGVAPRQRAVIAPVRAAHWTVWKRTASTGGRSVVYLYMLLVAWRE